MGSRLDKKENEAHELLDGFWKSKIPGVRDLHLEVKDLSEVRELLPWGAFAY